VITTGPRSEQRPVTAEVRALPAVEERIVPLYEPMERAAMAALSRYKDGELALLLDFLNRARDAALVAMAELRTLAAPPRPKSPGRARRPRR
jgi:hypothetical protein